MPVSVFQSPVGRTESPSSSLEETVRCGCHVTVEDKTPTKARNKLILACLIALFFMIGEVIGKLHHITFILCVTCLFFSEACDTNGLFNSMNVSNQLWYCYVYLDQA